MAQIRPIADPELDAALEILRRAGFGPSVDRLLSFPRASPDGEVFVARRRRRGAPAGVVACASFGATGWIGSLAVTPEAQRRGLGSALTEAAIAWLRERGAATVQLYATPMGRPVYERLGFVAEGASTAWRGTGGVRDGVAVRRLTEADRPTLAAMDRAATGEDRGAVLNSLQPLAGLAAERDGAIAGYALASPWSEARPVLADDPQIGVALMAACTAGPDPGTLIVPEANVPAVEAVRHWGFARLNTAERMRLGPAPGWHAERQFGQFNLFWG
jgi:GNAT superfamily N-acetyltransferase